MTRHKYTVGIAFTALLSILSSFAYSQWGGRNASAPLPPSLDDFPQSEFTFCTVAYSPNGYHEPLGFGWNTDFPDSGHNFMLRLSQLTTIKIKTDEYGEPVQEVPTPSKKSTPWQTWQVQVHQGNVLQASKSGLRKAT